MSGGADPRRLRYQLTLAILAAGYPMPGVVKTAGVKRAFVGGFLTDPAPKDVRLAVAAGDATGTDLAFATLVVKRLESGSELGNGMGQSTPPRWSGVDDFSATPATNGTNDLQPSSTANLQSQFVRTERHS